MSEQSGNHGSSIGLAESEQSVDRSSSIGLAELISQVKKELLFDSSDKDKNAPVLFVDSVDLELQVTVKKETNGKINIGVIPFLPSSILGGEVAGRLGRDDVQTIKVKLSPLYNKEQLVKWLETLYPEALPEVIEKSVKAFSKKAGEGNLADQF